MLSSLPELNVAVSAFQSLISSPPLSLSLHIPYEFGDTWIHPAGRASYYRPSLRGGSVVKLIRERKELSFQSKIRDTYVIAVIFDKIGSCWALSVVGAVDGINKIKTRELIYLWEQEFIDYYREDGNGGCDGGPCEDGFGNHDVLAVWHGTTVGVGSPRARNEAKLRYKEKKLKHIIGKKVRYASRRARAYPKKIVRGRFVKAGDNYDYDPSSLTMKSMSFLFP
ncbi:hypothetical protein IGI04_016383 [Brassica rapa subsp. trilocularis]|uniref:CCT domain-containing protein n=1 Tax=Brassica rapa subsp. trilocularis TaxID=1813537 RepID=A0ABQ7MST8_BRACM|nr:hypothetical protein IGI04_028330 [Brassica rapa subsp. trilocularis]KAG5401776.1 hypothetical protein IGI04_016383 [Brassica rapa subsp. trilocularis]